VAIASAAAAEAVGMLPSSTSSSSFLLLSQLRVVLVAEAKEEASFVLSKTQRYHEILRLQQRWDAVACCCYRC
jgi:hypothetical protein